MNILTKIGAVSLLITASCFAAPTQCVNGSYADYMALTEGCFIQNLLFSGFLFSNPANPPGNAIPASSVAVTITASAGLEGLLFNPGMGVATGPNSTNYFQDVALSFVVSAMSSAVKINDVHLFSEGTFSGTGNTRVNETVCLGVTSLPQCTGGNSLFITATNPPLNPSGDAVFSGQDRIFVYKDINVSSGTNGTAGITGVSNTYSYSVVPEPMSLGLIGGGLLVIGFLRRRKH